MGRTEKVDERWSDSKGWMPVGVADAASALATALPAGPVADALNAIVCALVTAVGLAIFCTWLEMPALLRSWPFSKLAVPLEKDSATSLPESTMLTSIQVV